MSNDIEFLVAGWPAPANVRACTTMRAGGASRGAYASFNLGDHVGDDPQAVQQNRAQLRTALPAEPLWLKQVHGANVVNAAQVSVGVEADGAWTDRPGVVCAVLTADCLPIFLCDTRATKVALLHAGWRGLARGIVESGLRALDVPAHELLAWFGPAIGPDAYEIGDEMRRAFVHDDPGAAEAFRPTDPGRWHADLYALARRRLQRLGVHAVTGGERCTLRERERFYSYRRDGVTGRMASLIWLVQ